MRENLTRIERLRSRVDFSSVFQNPDYRFSCRGARLVAKRNGLEFSRFAATLTKKYGNAVKRNYNRRILKEIYRKNKPGLQAGCDIVIVLYPGKYCYHDRKKQFFALIRGIPHA